MSSNINPTLEPTKSLDKFRFWCQKVLPLVYDDSLSYYEVLGKMVVQLNDVIDNINADTANVLTLKDAFDELQEYVDNFFDDIEHLAEYAERAEAAQTAANSSAINAASSAVNASISSQAAMDARAAAQKAAQDATASKNDAVTAATTATTKAGEAAQSAINAQTAQASASQNATLADAARTAAQGFANDAAQDASVASNRADAAATSEQNIENLVENLPSDFTELVNDVNDLKETVYDIFDEKTINDASIASFGDGANDVPIKNLVVDIEAVQSGTGDPSPDNIRPITGWTEIIIQKSNSTNVFDETANPAKYIDASGAIINSVANSAVSDKIYVNSGITFAQIITKTGNGTLLIAAYDKNDNLLLRNAISGTARTTMNIPEGTNYIRFAKYNTSNECCGYLYSGTIRTDFDTLNTISITLPSEAGTVYGGSVDVTNGTLTVTDAQIASYNGEELPSSWISDRDVYTQGQTPTIGAQVVYKLNEPITYLLTPQEIKTLIGSNYIWADTGNIDITYYINSNASAQIALVKAIIAPVLENMIADTALDVNDFRIVGNTLYRVTANIASGGTLTVGTNVVATTVAEVLKSLLN